MNMHDVWNYYDDDDDDWLANWYEHVWKYMMIIIDHEHYIT